jgi:RNA polymerase sigma-70 factor, ECF subfamily
MDADVQALLEKRRYARAFERLLELYEVKVFRMAVMYLKDPGRAEEVAQDIFLKLWQSLPGYDGRAAPSTWLYTIARNTCLSAVRSEARRRTSRLDEIAEPAASDSPADSDAFRRIELRRGLERLPEAQREAICLFYLQEKSIGEVARMLNLPEGTVKSHLHRARAALAVMMKE